jgi:Protein of unknown function (DUF1501)
MQSSDFNQGNNSAACTASRPFDRRTLLQRSALGVGALGLATLMSEQGLAVDGLAAEGLAGSPLSSHGSHFPGKAKRVIHFFLNGGPSHVDTFDPKPALLKHAGQYTYHRTKNWGSFPITFSFSSLW